MRLRMHLRFPQWSFILSGSRHAVSSTDAGPDQRLLHGGGRGHPSLDKRPSQPSHQPAAGTGLLYFTQIAAMIRRRRCAQEQMALADLEHPRLSDAALPLTQPAEDVGDVQHGHARNRVIAP